MLKALLLLYWRVVGRHLLPWHLLLVEMVAGHVWLDGSLLGVAVAAIDGGNAAVVPACSIRRVSIDPFMAQQDTQGRGDLVPALISGPWNKEGSAGATNSAQAN